ncbi:hypothetical protein NHX12_017852 [Muraenolepis orangiensis]|uniref:Tr-type G domain-containing protein n=1 Tax=Muraenolepis orangiensis TaxID=630683 RepID=A0A9Q0IY32_9TELE|nr:hypothetical protein NHX12_017852 [Muraenolepis orangiensis]
MDARSSEACPVYPGQRTHNGCGSGTGGGRISKKSSRSRKGKRGRRRRSKKSRSNKSPPSYLPPETEEGNIEYKLKLVSPTPQRFEHLATQLKWRLQEGGGEAVYQIGVEDNGMLVGLSEEDMKASVHTLQRMAEKVGADITVLREREVEYDSDRISRKITEVLVRKVPDDQQFLDLRVAVLGNVDSGKSTLLGVLTQGELDNGRGRARLNLFRHLHEIQTGRTSSISFEILGFNSKGEMITFMDLAGHHKYMKTTIFAGTTREHLGLALALKVPIFLVLSKVDLCSRPTVERTLRQLERVLKQPGCNKVPFLVSGPDDAVTAAQQFTQSTSITPILLVSSVVGEGLQLLQVFLNLLPPLSSRGFLRLRVGSIQRNRSGCRLLRAGQAATLALGNFDRSLLRKFEASIVLLFHAKTFRRGSQVTVHVGNVRQTATVLCLQGKEELRTGERAVVRFRFIKHAEYLRLGAKLLFREGVAKGIGHVTRLLPASNNQDQNQRPHRHDR